MALFDCELHVRVFTLPSVHGERVVLRLLDKKVDRLDLDHLGMPDTAHRSLSRALTKSLQSSISSMV